LPSGPALARAAEFLQVFAILAASGECSFDLHYKAIQESLLFLEPVRSGRDALNERAVREVVKEISLARQRKIFVALLSRQSEV
jgi:hypothetical protein